MKSDESSNIDEKIFRFLNNEMTNEEAKDFSKMMESDSDLKTLVESNHEIYESIKRAGRNELIQRLKLADEKMAPIDDESTRLFPNRQIVIRLVAAVTLLLAVSAIVLLSSRSNASSDKLFAEYFSPMERILPSSGRGLDKADQSDKAIEFYLEGNYDESIEILEEIIQAPSDPLMLYLATANLALGDQEKSILQLEQYLNTASELRNEAMWFIALAYLKANKQEQVIAYLNQIKEGHFYKRSADGLMEELN